MFKKYLYGGTVRDKLLNIESNDLDYVVVFDNPTNIEDAFELLQEHLKSEGFDLFYVTSDGRYTIRSKYPKTHEQYPGRYADFTLSESRGTTSDLETFLRRCDFTINAIAMDDSGGYYDPLGGIIDLDRKIIRACNDVVFNNDPIRIIRYFRFAYKYELCMNMTAYREHIFIRDVTVDDFAKLQINRIKDELAKCFVDPIIGIRVISDLRVHVPEICEYIFSKIKLRTSVIK